MEVTQVSKQAIEQARNLGVFGGVEKFIMQIAKSSAPFTHEEGNRRYEGYILNIVDGVVVSVLKQGTAPVKTQDKDIAINCNHNTKPEGVDIVCPDCNNDGDFCQVCNTTGKVTIAASDYNECDFTLWPY